MASHASGLRVDDDTMAGERHAVYPEGFHAAPCLATAAAFDQWRIRAALQRGQGTRTGNGKRPHAGADRSAVFYSDNFLLLWQRTLRGIGATINSIGDNGRLFALANMAAADAAIGAWDNKRHSNFWRPITAIQEGANDGNSQTEGDPSWLPFLPTPPYPAYTSGANNLTGSMTRTLGHLLGDKTTFSVFSTPANVTKTYHRFSDMAADVVDVRIYQGIHFRFDDTVARRTGTRAADWAVSHFLRPLH